MATPPRQVLPGTTYAITKRCISRTCRLVPNKRVVKIVEYCLAHVAASRGIQLHTLTFMSNHFHMVLTDPRGVLPDFMKDLDSLITRNLNAMRGINGRGFEDGYTAKVITDIDAAIAQAAYTLLNPVAVGLVARARGWKGVTSARMTFGQRRAIRRPRSGIWRAVPRAPKGKRKRPWSRGRERRRGRCTAPDVVELVLEPFPKTMTSRSPESVHEAIRYRVEKAEHAAEKRRLKTGRSVMGMKRVIEHKWWEFPRTLEDMFEHVSLISGDDRERVAEAKQQQREFEAAYRLAMDEVREGRRPVFPAGTWLMVKRYGYACASP